MLSLSCSFIPHLYNFHHQNPSDLPYVSLGYFCAITKVIAGFAYVDHSLGCGFVFI